MSVNDKHSDGLSFLFSEYRSYGSQKYLNLARRSQVRHIRHGNVVQRDLHISTSAAFQHPRRVVTCSRGESGPGDLKLLSYIPLRSVSFNFRGIGVLEQVLHQSARLGCQIKVLDWSARLRRQIRVLDQSARLGCQIKALNQSTRLGCQSKALDQSARLGSKIRVLDQCAV